MTVRERMDDLFAGLLSEGGNDGDVREWSPRLDLSESDKAFVLRMDLPGVTANDIEIHVKQNTLTVSGEKKSETEEATGTFHRIERCDGKFCRMVTFPCPVVEGKVEARYRDGVLTITLPKTVVAPVRRVVVNST
jgi:HSP20 family protein